MSENGIIYFKEHSMTEQPQNDYDGAWKAALDVYLKEFLELCFPSIHAAIDWSRSYRFLETELPCVLICRETVAVPRSVSNRASGVRQDHHHQPDGTPDLDRCRAPDHLGGI
jgi:hypothetical protein